MFRQQLLPSLLLIILASCNAEQSATETQRTASGVVVVGAMKNVMWKGQLASIIQLADIEEQEGLYGLGPVSDLQGELLINDGRAYVSRVLPDSSMAVEETYAVGAPFFVYSHVKKWTTLALPTTVSNGKELERHLDQLTKEYPRPFVFKLTGTIQRADIHVQNLAPGSKVSSPAEAHQGQVNYALPAQEVEVIGFFSTDHQGVFTHHDSYVHLHLITGDGQKMGHVDQLAFKAEEMTLYLPKQ